MIRIENSGGFIGQQKGTVVKGLPNYKQQLQCQS